MESVGIESLVIGVARRYVHPGSRDQQYAHKEVALACSNVAKVFPIRSLRMTLHENIFEPVDGTSIPKAQYLQKM